MEVKDLSWNEETSKRFNNPLLPRSIRGLIVGKSGCGKTTLLLNLLLNPGWLDYDNLQVFGRSLFQPEYKILKKAFEENYRKKQL
jgi:ABC-type glutathione transport system ATPase component